MSKLLTAEYAFVQQVEERGVFSFCMCPGGILVPSSTEEGTVVLNGMSNAAHNSKWANAGVVVDNQGGRNGKVLMRPGVGQDMHRQADRLQAAALCKLHRVRKQCAVRSADHSEFAFVQRRDALHLRIEIAGQKVKGRPDARDIVHADDVGARVHQFKLKLRGGGGQRRAQF